MAPSFWTYLGKRAVDRFLVLFTALILQFVLLRVFPYYVMGVDPAMYFLNPNLTPKQQELIREQFGLYDPLPVQFQKYILSLFTGNLGFSFLSRQPVFDQLMQRLPNTILLIGSATVLQVITGLVFGVIAAMKRGTKNDATIVGSSLFLSSFPVFYLGLILLLVFGFYLKQAGFFSFPLAGTMSRPPPSDPLQAVLDVLWHLCLPLTTLVTTGFAGFALFIRGLLITQLGEDYIVTARAKGLTEKDVMFKHALRNVLPPVLTVLSLTFPGIVGGAVITETVFSWYGVGRWLYDASIQFDYPVVQGVLFISIILTLFSLYVCDVILGFVDPRVRLK